MSRKRWSIVLGVALAVWIAQPAQADEFRWEGPLAAGKAVEIKGLNGGIEATSADGSSVVITATKRARRGDPEEVKIEVVEHAGGVTVCAVYPAPSGWTNECVPGKGDRTKTRRGDDVSVSFKVQVPAGVRFVGRTVNGDVEATGLTAEAEAHTVNGNIELATSGYARAETVNGGIRASLGRGDWKEGLDFETVNGSIRVELPPETAADVHAETVNGSIETDFPLTVKGRFGSRKMSGTIGGGGRELSLETVNGSIHLQKR